MIEHQIGALEEVGCYEVGGWWNDTLAAAGQFGQQVMLAKREKQALRAGVNPGSALLPTKPAVDVRLWAGVGAALVVAWLVLRK